MSQKKRSSEAKMSIGFIGIGGIATAMVRGLICCSNFNEEILISRRGQANAKSLAETFTNVKIMEDNQQILDQCDCVFFCVLPDQARPLLGSLKFSGRHKLVSLVMGLSVAEMANLTGLEQDVFRIIPMPTCEQALGPIPLYPEDPDLVELLSRIGTVIVVDDENKLNAISAGSAVMASFFELVAGLANWLEGNDINPNAATNYATSLYQALASLCAGVEPKLVPQLSEDCLTPGGLNEQVLKHCRENGWVQIMDRALSDALIRVKKEAD